MARVQQMTVSQLEASFPDDNACKAFLASQRWPEQVACPRCGSVELYGLPARPFHWQCQACDPNGYRFSVLVGTIFENTKIPLKTWFRAIHMLLTGKKGVAALEVQRVLGLGSYRSAWFMMHRIRAALTDKDFRKLMGIVEVDETYVGGKSANKHWNKRGPKGGGGPGTAGKHPIVGAVTRKGNVVSLTARTPRLLTRSRMRPCRIRSACSPPMNTLAIGSLTEPSRTKSPVRAPASTWSAPSTLRPSRASGP